MTEYLTSDSVGSESLLKKSLHVFRQRELFVRAL